jgi:hypothetical protein
MRAAAPRVGLNSMSVYRSIDSHAYQTYSCNLHLDSSFSVIECHTLSIWHNRCRRSRGSPCHLVDLSSASATITC